MNNLFSKSANRLTKNSSISLELLNRQLQFIQTELRHNRSDNQDIIRMLNKILIDKHLQMQVDSYFEDNPEHELEDK